MESPLLRESDKAFWHRFVEVYEPELARLDRVAAVMEFGVFKGNSIRWLKERYPGARIIGCDILPRQPEWPAAEGILYVQMDQGSREQIRAVFRLAEATFDLIIEDGSHFPEHQRNCLVESLPHVRSGGIYVLEDIHTSHPQNPMFLQLGRPALVGPLHLLLAIEHLRSTGAPLDDTALTRLSTSSLFSRDEVQLVYQRCAEIRLFKRATLPHRCYRCGRSDYDFGALKCQCGVELYHPADSMTAVIHVA